MCVHILVLCIFLSGHTFCCSYLPTLLSLLLRYFIFICRTIIYAPKLILYLANLSVIHNIKSSFKQNIFFLVSKLITMFHVQLHSAYIHSQYIHRQNFTF